MAKKQKPRRTGRLGAFQKKLLFAAAWSANGGNGREAARAAGSKGQDSSLDVIASRMLRDVQVQEMLKEKVEAVENGMGAAEVLDHLTRIARLYLTPINIFDFVTYLGPTGDPEPMTAVSLEDAQAQVRERGSKAGQVQAPPGFAIDLPKAERLGKGIWVRELSHDAETGAPKLKVESNLALIAESRKALDLIARCKGMYRDAPAPPERPNLTAEQAFRMMPLSVQQAYHAAYKEALAKARAVTVEAKRIGG